MVSLVAAGLLADRSLILFCLSIVGIGLGIGACWAFASQRVMSGARPGDEAAAAASVPTVQQMGFALGAALSGLAANSAGFAVGLPRETMARVALVVPICFAVSAALAAVTALRLNARREADGPAGLSS